MADAGEPIQATRLDELERQIEARDQPRELIALAMAIDDLGRELALEITRLAAEPELAAPLRPVLLRVPAVHTRALLCAAEKLDDAGNARGAVRVLIEALRKALDARMVEVVSEALGFMLEAFGQRAAAERVRALATVLAEPASRREIRARYLTVVDELPALIDWSAIDDEQAFD